MTGMTLAKSDMTYALEICRPWQREACCNRCFLGEDCLQKPGAFSSHKRHQVSRTLAKCEQHGGASGSQMLWLLGMAKKTPVHLCPARGQLPRVPEHEPIRRRASLFAPELRLLHSTRLSSGACLPEYSDKSLDGGGGFGHKQVMWEVIPESTHMGGGRWRGKGPRPQPSQNKHAAAENIGEMFRTSFHLTPEAEQAGGRVAHPWLLGH